MERQTAAIQREKDALQQEARSLAQRLEAVIHDKFIPKSHIDADTPIDKTFNFLHAFIAVYCCGLLLSDHVCRRDTHLPSCCDCTVMAAWYCCCLSKHVC